MNTRDRLLGSVALGGLVLAGPMLGGCAQEEPQPLRAEAVYRPSAETRQDEVDRGGIIAPGGPARRTADDPAINPPPVHRPPAPDPTRPIEPSVGRAVPDPAPAAPPSTTRPATMPVGSFMTVGGVVANVAGQPIFADALMRQIAPVLSARAPDLNEQQFRALAQSEIQKQLTFLIRGELEYAAAMRELDAADKDRAELLTMNFRERLITQAGGSLEVARSRARAEGIEFDELIRQQYRLFLVRLYYEKKVYPRVQISAADIRRYYESKKAEEFTERATARWRMIRITSKNMGGVAEAEAKANELHERVTRGEDFASVAGSINHDPLLLRNAGDVGEIDKGAYRLEEVEAAAWALEPGQISPVVRVGEDFFIIKLEQKKTGRVVPFEEAWVQQQITDTLRQEQVQRMRDARQRQLESESQGTIVVNQDMMATAVQIAMQNYPIWARAN